LSDQQLVEDIKTLRKMLLSVEPSFKIVAPDIAMQLVPGVLRRLPPSLEGFIEAGGTEVVDAFSYHWYPLDGGSHDAGYQRFDPFYATLKRALSIHTLDRGVAVAEQVAALIGNRTQIWNGETALACFGGQAEVSQTWVGVMWWADSMGLSALQGQQVVARQTLCGARYGLLDPIQNCTQANPDYWVTLLWKRVMGNQVFRATATSENLRAYAHSTANTTEGGISVMLLNVGNATVNVSVSFGIGDEAPASVEAFFLTPYPTAGGDDLVTQRTLLNGKEIRMSTQGEPPPLVPIPVPVASSVALAPYSVTFLVSKR
jgi:heparanase